MNTFCQFASFRLVSYENCSLITMKTAIIEYLSRARCSAGFFTRIIWILTTTLGSRYDYYLYFTQEEIEAQVLSRQHLNPGSLTSHRAVYIVNWESGATQGPQELSPWAGPTTCLLCGLQKSSQLSEILGTFWLHGSAATTPVLKPILLNSSPLLFLPSLNCLNLVVIH